MSNTKTLYLVGYASGLAAANQGCAKGPVVLQASPYLSALQKRGVKIHWEQMIEPSKNESSKTQKIVWLCQELAQKVNQLALEKKFFTILGGDHSSAVGTWSGASHALSQEGPLGLIWIDAHMDSHIPETSPSGNIHGMPLACLLGYGNPELTQLMNPHPKLEPSHVCLIGVRSFEPGELKLLKDLKVKTFYIDEVKQRGLEVVMLEAIQLVSHQTAGFGITIDIDSMDPKDAPGTGMPEPNGISAKELSQALWLIANHPKLIGAEIVEFDPTCDQNQLTEKLIPELISSLTLGK